MRTVGVLLALAVVCVPGTARAESANQAAAVAAFDEGQRLSEAGRHAEACSKFEESNRLDPQLGALLHLADCYERVGKLASAWTSFRDASVLAERRRDERAGLARERATSLASRVSHLRIVLPSPIPPGLEILYDGVALAPSLLSSKIPVDAGEHTVFARAPDRVDYEAKVNVGEGALETIEIPPLAEAGTAPARAEGALSVADAADGDSAPGATQRILGFAALGLGALGLGAGAVFFVLQNNKGNDADDVKSDFETFRESCVPGPCPNEDAKADATNARLQDLEDDQRRLQTFGIVAAAVGGVAVATGVVLLLTAPDEEPTTSVFVAPSLDGPRLMIQGRF